MAVIGSLSVKLGLVTVQWDQATAKAKQQAKDLQKSFNSLTGELSTLANGFKSLGGSLGLGAIGFAALTQQALAFADATIDVAKGFDISVAKVLQFKDAIQTSGGNAEGATKILNTLFTKIQEAQSGNEAAISQFERLGITFAELSALQPEQAINRVFNALNESSLSTFERVKMVKEMLGKQGIGLSIDEVAQKLNMSVSAYKKNEESLRKLAEVSDNLKTSMDNLKLAFADVISPFASGGVISIEKFKIALYAIGSAYVISNVVKLAEALWLVYKALQANAIVTAAIGASGGWKGIATILGAAGVGYAASEMLPDAPVTNPRQAEGRLERMPNADEQQDATKGRPELIAAQAKVALAKELTRIEREQNDLRIQALMGDRARIELRGVELTLQKELATIANARAQALSKEKLSADQVKLINAEFNAEAAKANSKAKSDKAFINEQERLATSLLIRQTELVQINASNQKDLLVLKYKNIGLDERDVALSENKLALTQELARLEAQNNADKLRTNMSDAERAEINKRYEIERQSAITRSALQEATINKAYQEKLLLMMRTNEYAKKYFDLEMQSGYLQQAAYAMRESDVRKAQEQINHKRTMLELEKQIKDARSQYGEGLQFDFEQERITILMEQEKQLHSWRMKSIDEEEARRKSFMSGFEEAARQFAIDAENYGRLGADMFTSAIGNMNSAIDNFARTGEFSFKQFARSVVQDIMAMILKFQAMQLVMMAMRSMGFGGFSSPMMSAGTGGATFAAAGGEIDGPTIVGENGPELFIPQRRGTVIPNMQASSYTGAQPQVVYNGPYIANMNAIDTQSATQFLSRNKQAVWSANQSAQRSLPMSK